MFSKEPTSDFIVISCYPKNLHACWSQNLYTTKKITWARQCCFTGSNASIAWGAVTGMGCNETYYVFPACINMLGSHGIGWTVSLLAATSISVPWLYRQLLNTFLVLTCNGWVWVSWHDNWNDRMTIARIFLKRTLQQHRTLMAMPLMPLLLLLFRLLGRFRFFLPPSKVYGAARRQTFGHLSPTQICQQFPLLNSLSLSVVFDTLPKTSIAPGRRPSEKETYLPTPVFQVLC